MIKNYCLNTQINSAEPKANIIRKNRGISLKRRSELRRATFIVSEGSSLSLSGSKVPYIEPLAKETQDT